MILFSWDLEIGGIVALNIYLIKLYDRMVGYHRFFVYFWYTMI